LAKVLAGALPGHIRGVCAHEYHTISHTMAHALAHAMIAYAMGGFRLMF